MDKPKPNFTLDDIKRRVLGERTEIYDGPLAFTTTEYAKSWGRDIGFVRRNLQRCVEEGTMVRVTVYREDSLKRPFYPPAYVPTEVYRHHLSQIETITGENLG